MKRRPSPRQTCSPCLNTQGAWPRGSAVRELLRRGSTAVPANRRSDAARWAEATAAFPEHSGQILNK